MKERTLTELLELSAGGLMGNRLALLSTTSFNKKVSFTLDDQVGTLVLDPASGCSYVDLPSGRMFVAWNHHRTATVGGLRSYFGEVIPNGSPVHVLGYSSTVISWLDRLEHNPDPSAWLDGELEGFWIRAGRFRHCLDVADGAFFAMQVRLGCPTCTDARDVPRGWLAPPECTPPRC